MLDFLKIVNTTVLLIFHVLKQPTINAYQFSFLLGRTSYASVGIIRAPIESLCPPIVAEVV
jgi:hypothetical protein